ncbi:MAG: hypothetical protein HKN87_21975 [Saprospiraceae bacterium]|nr:hypothetical protein [Saprospiraceae bacterium]
MRQQSFPIDNYFMYLAERYLDKASDLLREGSIVLHSVKKGYHLFEVNQDHTYEVEVLVGRKKVRSFSCECKHYLDHQMCAHIAAGIKMIVEQRAKRQHQKKKDANAKSASTLHVNKLVSKLEIQDLRAFVQKYAAQDTAFSLKLKAQFAHLVELKNNDIKYFEILRRHEKHIIKTKINRLKFRKISNFVADLLDLSADLSVHKNYQEAYGIIYGCLSYLISRNILFSPFEPIEVNLVTHERLQDLLRADIAPDLLKKVFRQARQLYMENDYKVVDSQLNLYYILFQAYGPSQQQTILEDVKKLHSTQVDLDRMLTQTLLRLYVEDGDLPSLRELILDEDHERGLLEEIFNILLTPHLSKRDGQDPHLKKVGKKWSFEILVELYERSSSRLQRNAMLHILQQAGAPQELLQRLYLDCFLKDTDQQVLVKLKQMDKWKRSRKVIIDHLQTHSHNRMLANLYRNEHMTEELIDMLESSNDMPLLLEHVQYLHNSNQDWTQKRLLQLMTQHLDKHLGYQSVSYVGKIIRTLEKNHLRRLSNKIKDTLIEIYPERSFFTKALKQV